LATLQRIVVVGATSSIAEHCLRLWVQQAAAEVTLVGRDAGRLERVAADLRVRSPASRVQVRTVDFESAAAITRLVDDIAAAGVPQQVLIAHGTLPQQAACEHDLALVQAALSINGLSAVLFAEAFAGHLQRAGAGTLAVIGSVAGDRGRKSNYVYGAAKGLVERYLQGLQHRLAGSAVRVVLVKPGPTDTPMTAHLKQRGQRLAAVEDVARAVVRGMQRGRPLVYAPARWALVMMVIRHLPRRVFDRLDI
jgi:hypothetical protein